MNSFTNRFLALFGTFFFINISIYAQAPNFTISISNSFGGSGNDEFFGGANCLDGGYFLTGLTDSNDGDIDPLALHDTSEIFVVKCDANGMKEWARTFGGNDYDKARYGMQDADSNYLVVGSTHSIDGDITFTHGNTELFVLKLDPSGNLIWMKQYGGTGWESGRYIIQSSDGNYVVGGYSSSKNFDVPAYGKGLHDGWIFKIDTAGTLIWSKTYGGTGVDRVRHFVELPDGGFAFTGSSNSNNFDCLGNHGENDFWVGRTDSVGDLLWSKQFGGTLEDWPFHIALALNGDYIVTGYSASNDGDVAGNYGSFDAWVLRVDSVGNLLNQKNFGGSGDDRLYKSYEVANGNILTAGFTQSTDNDLSGVHPGPTKVYWLMDIDTSLQMNWGYVIGGTGADLGKELLLNPIDSSIVIMGDSNSPGGAVLGNHGDFDFWLVKLDISTLLSPEPGHTSMAVYYDGSSKNLVVKSSVDRTVNLSVIDMTGKQLMNRDQLNLSTGTNQIDAKILSKISSGIYAITLTGQSLKQVYRIAISND